MSEKNYTIALLGQPNSGKSTLFNALTGSRQRVGNWPGKTVEKKEGSFEYEGVWYTVTDLPGSYSLSAGSDEEIVTREYIADGMADVVCILADASQLERSLYMLADFAGINTPAILLLNMMDVAKGRGKEINAGLLEKRLGIPVVPFVAADRKHYEPFYAAVKPAIKQKPLLKTKEIEEIYRLKNDSGFQQIIKYIPGGGIGQYTPLWLAEKVLEGDPPAIEKVRGTIPKNKTDSFNQELSNIKNGGLVTGDCKFQWIDRLLKDAVINHKEQAAALSRFDRLATSRRWGKWIALAIIVAGLVGAFIPAMPIMAAASLIPSVLSPPVSAFLEGLGASPFVISLAADGILNTLYMSLSMTGFVFGITLTFGIIEEVGYMARISYVFDGVMRRLGLQGKAIMPFIVSLGCTIGGAAGTRVIDSWGQRILTLILVWAVPCGAIFAVIPTLSSMFFGFGSVFVMLGIFLVMVIHMLVTARLFGRRLVPEEERNGMIMELPPYHKPKWGNLLSQTVLKSLDIFLRAFRVILVMSLLFFLLSYTSTGNVENSIIYRIGTFIEPVTSFFGLRWQCFMAFISSAISKEAVLGVLNALFTGTGTVYGSTFAAGAETAELGTTLAAAISKPEALAFIFAVSFNVPCVMAIASTYQECHSLKWTAKIIGYYMGLSLVIAFIVYHVSSLFF